MPTTDRSTSAIEMRDATTDQFAFDGSRRRPDHPNTRTALDLMRLLLERGADPNKTFTGQLHSTSMPNTDRFNNTPFFRAAVAADVEALKVLIAGGADLAQSPAAPPAAAAGTEGPPAAGRGRINPNAGRTAAMVTMSGGRGPAMTGGPAYIREAGAPVPYREPGSRKPEDAFALLLESGANPNATGPDGSVAPSPGGEHAQPRDDPRAGARARRLHSEEQRGLHRARRRRRQAARRAGAGGVARAGALRAAVAVAAVARPAKTSPNCCVS